MQKSVLNLTLSLMAFSVVSACAESANKAADKIGEDTAETVQNVETAMSKAAGDKAAASETSETPTATVTRSADSHTHGDAELAIVLEGKRVTVELESPLFNILGFEHKPDTDAQKVRVKKAEMQLGQAAALFVFNAEAGCEVALGMAAPELFTASREDHDDEHEHQDDHKDHDDHADHDDHEDTHKDVLLQYQYECSNPASLSNVSVNLFEFFEEMADIDVTYLGPATQKQVKMTRKNTKMMLSR